MACMHPESSKPSSHSANISRNDRSSDDVCSTWSDVKHRLRYRYWRGDSQSIPRRNAREGSLNHECSWIVLVDEAAAAWWRISSNAFWWQSTLSVLMPRSRRITIRFLIEPALAYKSPLTYLGPLYHREPSWRAAQYLNLRQHVVFYFRSM